MQINTKIYDQEDKLAGMTKQMSGQVDDVKKANVELRRAEVITRKRNKNLTCWVLFIFVLCLILAGSIYFFMTEDSS